MPDRRAHQPFRVGLTGGIASGKTTAANAFAALGVPVVDADVIAREVVAPGSRGLAILLELLGPAILTATGELDRAALRARLFADASLRGQVEAVLHPLIAQRLWRQADAVTAPYVLLVVPLLLETGLETEVDRVLVVDCPEDIQLARLTARDGETADTARRMLAAQLPRATRLARADDVLVNNAGVNDLNAQVQRLHQRYLALTQAAGGQ